MTCTNCGIDVCPSEQQQGKHGMLCVVCHEREAARESQKASQPQAGEFQSIIHGSATTEVK